MRRKSCRGVVDLRVVAALIVLLLPSACSSRLEGPTHESTAATERSNVDGTPESSTSGEDVVRAAITKSASADTVMYHEEISASSEIPASSFDVQVLRAEELA